MNTKYMDILLLNQKGDFGLAEKECQELLKSNENDEQIISLLYHALLGQKKYDELRKLAFLYYKQTEDDDAFAILWKELYFNEKNEDAIDFCNQILKKHPQYMRALLWKGMSYNQMGDLEKGFEVWQEIPSNHFRYLDVLNNSGLIYESLGQLDEAEKYYKAVIQSDLDGYTAKAKACVNLGNLWKHDSPKKAIKKYNQAIKFSQLDDFSFSAPFFNLGDIYFRQKQYKKALDNYGICLEIDGMNETVSQQIKKCEAFLDRK